MKLRWKQTWGRKPNQNGGSWEADWRELKFRIHLEHDSSYSVKLTDRYDHHATLAAFGGWEEPGAVTLKAAKTKAVDLWLEFLEAHDAMPKPEK